MYLHFYLLNGCTVYPLKCEAEKGCSNGNIFKMNNCENKKFSINLISSTLGNADNRCIEKSNILGG